AEAFDAYMQGRFFFDRDGDGDLERAGAYYELATKLDSSYALAWVGLSRVRFKQADAGSFTPKEGQRKALEQEARKAVEQALALDPNLAEAHSQIGRIRMFVDWDWTGASASVQRALALDPGNSAVVGFASRQA